MNESRLRSKKQIAGICSWTLENRCWKMEWNAPVAHFRFRETWWSKSLTSIKCLGIPQMVVLLQLVMEQPWFNSGMWELIKWKSPLMGSCRLLQLHTTTKSKKTTGQTNSWKLHHEPSPVWPCIAGDQPLNLGGLLPWISREFIAPKVVLLRDAGVARSAPCLQRTDQLFPWKWVCPSPWAHTINDSKNRDFERQTWDIPFFC